MTYDLHHGDCIDYMAHMPYNSVSSIVTDPPYHLLSIVKRFGKESSAPAQFGTDGAYSRHSTGFMGKKWDGGDIAHDPETWAECLRVAKPGAYLLAFGGTRTFHRLAVAIEDAGWEIRDCVMWVYGSGFPKSHDVSKAIDKESGIARKVIGKGISGKMLRANGQNESPYQQGKDRIDFDITAPSTDAAKEWEGWGTALKPAWEPIIMARKPVEGTVASNVLKYGTGAINIDASRIEIDNETVPINKLEEWSGFGQMKQPDYKQEINTKGRWPANLIHDGSEEVLELLPNTESVMSKRGNGIGTGYHGSDAEWDTVRGHEDSGSVARFFYCAKASQEDRNEGVDLNEVSIGHNRFDQCKTCGGYIFQNKDRPSACQCEVPLRKHNTVKGNSHPTVKPIALMRYLCKLVTPPDGVVFDPFMGSGSTGKAALLEGFNFIGCELEDDYFKIAQQRIRSTLIQEEFFKGD